MLYTGKGDDGTTKTIKDKERISKSSGIAEALGSLDEINTFLGLCKVKSAEKDFEVNGEKLSNIVHEIQHTLFIIQAELAGSDKRVDEEKVKRIEVIINAVEKILPPIKTFLISGATELSAYFDIARTIARRAERRVVEVSKEEGREVGKETLRYLNRLSSILYAFARLSNHFLGAKEEPPTY